MLGEYPQPLTSSHSQWIKGGRMIPTTPWDAVWNAIAQWMGVRDESDLDVVLPNRNSFSECDLFTDKALFLDGACECTIINGECSCQCDVTTYSPTVSPTLSPSASPSTDPTSHPSALPSMKPSASPTLNPTDSPTADLPDGGTLVQSIIDPEVSFDPFGCNSWARAWASIDGSTEMFHCDRTDLYNISAGLIFSSPYVQATIAKKVRVYRSAAGTSVDPVDVTVEGRINPKALWEVIGSGDLEYSNNSARNVRSRDLHIVSTYESGDLNYTFAEVDFPSNSKVYSDYKLTFSSTRSYTSSRLQFAEVEIAGMLLPPPPTPPPTLSPSVSPTKSPSVSPTLKPSSQPSSGPSSMPSSQPSSAPSDSPTAAVAEGSQAVNTVLYPGSVQSFGCSRTIRAGHAIASTTEKYICDHLDMPTQGDGIFVSGFVLSPEHGKLSIAKDLRLYTHNNCANCDCVDYLLEGRVDANSAWEEIGSGDFPWRDQAKGRNERGLAVNSSFESGDNNLNYASVGYPSLSTAYLEYKFTCRRTRRNHRYFQLGRIELAGYILG